MKKFAIWFWMSSFLLFVVQAENTVETHHLVQIDHNEREVAMDTTHNIKENTVLAVIGDVSKYKNGIHTVNLHDYNTGYGVLKDINNKICLIAQASLQAATFGVNGTGFIKDVTDHMLEIKPLQQTRTHVADKAGPNIASFCHDYASFFVKAKPFDEKMKERRSIRNADLMSTWCIGTTCIASTTQYEALVKSVLG